MMYGDTEWFTFFPPSVAFVRGAAHRLRRISPVDLDEGRSLDATAAVFGYSSYVNLLEYLAFDSRYPHKWDDQIDDATKADRLELQVSSLQQCLDVPEPTARYLINLWRPSRRPPSFAGPLTTARMEEAKDELKRLGPGEDADYMAHLSATFSLSPPTAMNDVRSASRISTDVAVPDIHSRNQPTTILKLPLETVATKRRVKELKKLLRE
jgi:hypothetical protein